MDAERKTIRALLRTMAPNRAIDFITAFHLPEREEICVIEMEVNDLSYTQICKKHGFSPEMVHKLRRRAFSKMVDGRRYEEEKEKAGG